MIGADVEFSGPAPARAGGGVNVNCVTPVPFAAGPKLTGPLNRKGLLLPPRLRPEKFKSTPCGVAVPVAVLTVATEVPPPVRVPAFWVKLVGDVPVPPLMVKIPVFNVTGAVAPIRAMAAAMPLLSRLIAAPACAVNEVLFRA